MGEDLNTIGQFIILITSGAIIPLLLVIYKSRCKSICFGCITRDVINGDEDVNENTNVNENTSLTSQPQPEPQAEDVN